MNKQILLSILVISVAVVLVSGATVAYLSDTESSSGNLFQAGELDLKVDNTCHYDGMVCAPNADGEYVWAEESTGSSTYKGLISQSCDCTWLPTDLTDEKFFAFNDVKPGDHGEDTVSLNVQNDAWVCVSVYNLENNYSDCNQSKCIAKDGTWDGKACTELTSHCGTPGIGQGELQNYLLFTVWNDSNCNNILDQGEQILVENQTAAGGAWPIADSTTGTPLLANDKYCIGVGWKIDPSVGNKIQGDRLSGDIKFWTEQARNNPDFVCDTVGTGGLYP